MAESLTQRRQSLAAFQYRDFTLYQLARLFTVMASEMLSVAVGWQVFEITNRPLDLGFVGLAQFWPAVVLFLAAGHAADRFNRRNIVIACYALLGLGSTALFFLAISGSRSTHAIYAVLTLVGVARAFNGAAGQSMVPQLVPEKDFPNAVAWAQTVFNTATILGPALGGLIYALFRGPAPVYATSMAAAATVTAVSPAPVARASGRLIRTVSIFGISAPTGSGRYVRQSIEVTF